MGDSVWLSVFVDDVLLHIRVSHTADVLIASTSYS